MRVSLRPQSRTFVAVVCGFDRKKGNCDTRRCAMIVNSANKLGFATRQKRTLRRIATYLLKST